MGSTSCSARRRIASASAYRHPHRPLETYSLDSTLDVPSRAQPPSTFAIEAVDGRKSNWPALLGSPFGIVSALFLVVVWWCRELLTVTSRHTRRGSLMRHVHAGPAPAAQPPGRLTSRNAPTLASCCRHVRHVIRVRTLIIILSRKSRARPQGPIAHPIRHLFCPILSFCSRHCAFFQSPCWVRIWRTLCSGRHLSASASHGLYPTALSAASSSAVKIASIAFLSFVNTGQPGRMNG